MKRIAVAAVVLVAVVAGLLAVTGAPPVRTEPLTVAVPAGPDEPGTIDLDAQLHLPATTPAPALLLAHGFGSDRTAVDEAARTYAGDGYVVLTWSARGFGDSGGVIGLNDPDREVADVGALVDLLADRPEVTSQAPRDPLVGIAGGSYGGGLALLAAATEPRLDAVVAAAAWHSLTGSLSPNAAGTRPGVWAEQWASALFTAGALDAPDATTAPDTPDTPDALAELACGRLDRALCLAYVRAATTGVLDEEGAALLDRAGLEGRLGGITAPTMLISGLEDTLFGLDQSLANARGITAPLAVRWVPGDHGRASRVDTAEARAWLDTHLRGAPDDHPVFEWTDTVAGAPQPLDALPAPVSEAGDRGQVRTWSLGADGSLRDPAQDDGPAASLPLIRPPGGLPASITTLPGLGALADLVPATDVPGQSRSFTTPPLGEDVTLLGPPRLAVRLDAPVGEPLAFVTLEDVSPGGRTHLINAAVAPVRLPGGGGDVVLDLPSVAHRVVAGNRLRIGVATTDLAFADGREPAVLALGVGPAATLAIPLGTRDAVSPLPAWVRITAPVALLALLALVALALTRRHERRLGAEGEGPPSAAGDAPIVVRGLTKVYGNGEVAVDGLDLTVGRGQVFGLLGPNGAGKTTTMRMLLGLIRPTAGEIHVLGHRMRPGHPVLQRVGVLVEGPGFAPYLTGRQNLETWWTAGGRPLAEADLEGALAVADLGPAIDRPTRTYSHGMRQRLAIAQALLGRPELLVLDEPTDGLDPEQIKAMRGLLARLGQRGQTVLVSSHLLAEVEQMCTHAAVVRDGRVVAAGPVADLVGAGRSLVIRAEDPTTARRVLVGLVGADAVDVEGDGLVVRLGDVDLDAPAVVSALVAAGVGVRSAAPRGRLEDAFLQLTGGGT